MCLMHPRLSMYKTVGRVKGIEGKRKYERDFERLSKVCMNLSFFPWIWFSDLKTVGLAGPFKKLPICAPIARRELISLSLSVHMWSFNIVHTCATS